MEKQCINVQHTAAPSKYGAHLHVLCINPVFTKCIEERHLLI